MKTVFFTEEQLNNLDEIGKNIFEDGLDPTSTAYHRKLNRPEINWLRIITYIILPLLITSALVLVMDYYKISKMIIAAVVTMSWIIYVVFTLKKAVICAVKIYQRYAPDSVRNKCRFEPSCSEYMILAIEKYGFFKGVKKGISRLRRCNINHGGYDYP